MRAVNKKLIGFIIIFILLLTSIHPKGMENYSGLAALRQRGKMAATETIGAVNSKVSFEKICTIRMISGTQESLLNGVRYMARQDFYDIRSFMPDDLLVPCLLYYFISISIIFGKILNTMPRILRYIHNQDGEKNKVLQTAD